MGYTPDIGEKGLGQFNSSPGTVADLNQLLAIIAGVGNYRGAMAEEDRDDITGAALYSGLLVFNTTENALELYSGSGWEHVWRPETVAAVTFASPYGAAPAAAVDVRAYGGRGHLRGEAVRSSATFSTGTNYTLGTIPAGFRPAEDQLFYVSASATGVAARLVVQASGTLIFSVAAGFTGALSMGLSQVSWQIGT